MSKKMCRKESGFSRFLKAPVRILIRARDAYIRGMTSCAGNLRYSGASGVGNCHVGNRLPRSFSVSSSATSDGDDDFRELIRAASVRALGGSSEAMMNHSSLLDLRRNQSVGMGRIDEDKPCEFGQDDVLLFQRSRSYAVGVGNKGVGGFNYSRYI